jgi:hypothetical protein
MDLSIFLLIPAPQQKRICSKYRVGLRLIHRCPFVDAVDIYDFTKEKSLELYICKYLQKRLANAYRTDVSCSPFCEDIFHWDYVMNWKTNNKRKQRRLRIDQCHRLSRVKKMKERYQSFLLTWLSFIDQHSINNKPRG